MRVALYVRCSTVEQSTDLQKRELTEYANARGWAVYEIYEDHGKTGTNTNRPAFQKLLSDSKRRKFDGIVVYKLDRAFRSLKDLVTVLSEWNALGVSFISLRDHVDLSTPSGRLMTQIIGAMSEFEASLIRERVRAGLAHARAKGVVLGRKPSLDREKVFALRSKGMKATDIARELQCTRSAISKILGRPSSI